MTADQHHADVAIIGGGIIGISTAHALVTEHGVSTVVLEAEDQLASHQTGHNSGVIHSGLYYKPGSLKARMCAEGRDAMYEFCRSRAIAHERCGKVVVAVDDRQIPALDELERRGRANGLQGLRRLSAADVRELEPHLRGVAGLHVPETGIVDFGEVARSMATAVSDAGAQIKLGAAVTAVQRDGDGYVIVTRSGHVRCRVLVNCAGLYCDRIARMCGVAPGVRIVPFRGEYYTLSPQRSDLVRSLIYPVPDPMLPFLGVHFTRTIAGRVEIGPNAVLAFHREGYGWLRFSARDVCSSLSYPGFWKMAGTHWRSGVGEMYRSLSRRAFVASARAMIPDVQSRDVQRGRAGVRAQAIDSAGRLIDDFRLLETDSMVHVLNAPSPAATASISIGRHVAGSALQRLAGRSVTVGAEA